MLGQLGRVHRLGLATRGNTSLEADQIDIAINRGVNYLNWCGHADGMSRAINRMVPQQRSKVVVAVQLLARTAGAARREIKEMLGTLGTGYIDAVTYYYVEHAEEWEQIRGPDGAAAALAEAKADGTVRCTGLTSHQRPLVANIAGEGGIDLLMIRYNAAHRGAEKELFPLTTARRIPVITYTAVRWGALMRPTPDDPKGFTPPRAPAWYRFALCHPAVTVVLMAPDGGDELAEDLMLIDDWKGITKSEYRALCDHGERVYRHAGSFP